ncbi:hypothetical protein [Psychrobium sp. 1_MG-2023]|uniref:hypothetical protein n=1 Tax=Psychrobium sp. 1_MG-2023 TaxID=3062624 RepID=UPI000C3296F6|nr:hypothetical protein [Psychrobium sp. 1_MG-2023]MDP2561788.1 hypothetical protein [Psychrobium sp. 1_MG-2023]PKF59729.1 hypothetical protein CW748_00570 [Alteromonadales bacterium alter-6D02]
MLLTPVTSAEAALKLHVYDKKDKVNTTTESPQLQTHIFSSTNGSAAENEYSATPVLKTHIFKHHTSKHHSSTDHTSSGQAATSEHQPTPLLQMHVFNIEPNNQTQRRYNQVPALKMHIFDELTLVSDNEKEPLDNINTNVYLKLDHQQEQFQWLFNNKQMIASSQPHVIRQSLDNTTVNLGVNASLNSDWLFNVDLAFGEATSAENSSMFALSTSIDYRWFPIQQQSSFPTVELRPQMGLRYASQRLTTPFITDDGAWFGPWLGLDSRFQLSQSFSLNMSLEHHYASYSASTNLMAYPEIAPPQRRNHKATGHGTVAKLSGLYQLSSQTSLALSINYQDWQADNDKSHQALFANNSAEFTRVKRQSKGVNFGIRYKF